STDQWRTRVLTYPLRAWDAATGVELESLPLGGDTVCGLALAPDGKTLAGAPHRGRRSPWGPAAPARGGPLRGRGGPRGWDVAAQRGREVPAAGAGPFAAVALTPKGDLAAVIEEQRTGAVLRLLETGSGKERASIKVDARAVPPGWPGRFVAYRALPEAVG